MGHKNDRIGELNSFWLRNALLYRNRDRQTYEIHNVSIGMGSDIRC